VPPVPNARRNCERTSCGLRHVVSVGLFRCRSGAVALSSDACGIQRRSYRSPPRQQPKRPKCVQSSEYYWSTRKSMKLARDVWLLCTPIGGANPTPESGESVRCRETPMLAGIEVLRERALEPFVHGHPTLSSADVGWSASLWRTIHGPSSCPSPRTRGALPDLVLRGSVKYDVLTRARRSSFWQVLERLSSCLAAPSMSSDGTGRRTCRSRNLSGLLVSALDEDGWSDDIELTEHWI